MSKNYPLILLLILLSGLNYAQPAAPALLYSDFIQLSSDSLNNVYYTYKIPLNHLVFEKEADLFLAQYRISVEVFDADHEKFITRAIKEKNIQVPDYEQTRSPVIFSEGIMSLNLWAGTYSIQEIFYDYKSGREFNLPVRHLLIDSVKEVSTPLIIDDQKTDCNEKKFPVLSNYAGRLPFDENKYAFIIPVKNTLSDTINVRVIQNKDTLYNSVLTNPVKERIILSECGGKIVLDESPETEIYDIYRIDGISGKIKEGAFQITISAAPGQTKMENFYFSCGWINKPLSLKNIEMAITALKFIEKDSVINSLLKDDEENYGRDLANYWKKIDPTPGTEFNPLMQEFYSRIDYAVKNFTTIAGANGANTDRGKIYIRFGKPVEINRTSDNYGNIIETWTYNNPQRKFVFIDKKGTGDFSLISG